MVSYDRYFRMPTPKTALKDARQGTMKEQIILAYTLQTTNKSPEHRVHLGSAMSIAKLHSK